MNILTSILLLTVLFAAQTPQTPAAADPNNVLRAETNVVLVDAVVTDKKGNYVRGLKQKDFKIWEDNKEQTIKSFSFEADPASPLNSQPRYLVLFFDNSTMNIGDQAIARKAAVSFIEANAGPNRLMAIVNYSGGLQIAQNFTADVERLKAVAAGTKLSMGPSANDAANGGLGRAAADFGARNMILGIRSLAKNLAPIPGRKTMVLLTAGFRVTAEQLSDVTATIDVCNRSNVAIYPIDVRGLVAGHAQLKPPAPFLNPPSSPFVNAFYQSKGAGSGGVGSSSSSNSSGGHGSAPAASSGGGRSGGSSGGSTGSSGRSGGASPVAPVTPARAIVPRIPESAQTNQQVMYMLADGTGGFVIVNTNDLLGGMQKIAQEMNEFYLIGYSPAKLDESSCHTIRVKVDQSGDSVRARTGYCNVKLRDVLSQTQTEKTLENRAAAAQGGNVTVSMRAPYFFTGNNTARVNVALEIPPNSIKFEKEKGKMRSTLNVLGIAYKKDGSVGARFSDAVKLEFDNEKEVELFRQFPYHYENQFDAASGEYNLKVVFSAGGENFGKIEQPLVIDTYDTKKFSISDLALSTHYQKTAELDQSLEQALLEDRTPLIAQGYQITPAGSTTVKKTGKAVVYFEIYEPGLLDAEPAKGLAVAIQVKAYDSTGAAKFDTGAFRIPVPEKGGNPAMPFAVIIPVNTLEPGAYKLEVASIDSLNNKFQRVGTLEIQ
jgi:VWFA-related protein